MRTASNKILYLILDCLFLNAGIYISLLIKFDGLIPQSYLPILPFTLILTTTVNVGVYLLFKLYSMLWIYAGAEEIIRIFFATIAGIIAQYIIASCFNRVLPIGIYIIFWLFTLFSVGGLRFCYRIVNVFKTLRKTRATKKRIMIVGAGEAASLIIKELKNRKQTIYYPVAAIDDNPSKHKTQINGVPVIGGRHKILKTAKEMRIDEIFIAIPSISKKETVDIINICKKSGCKLKVVPGIYNIVNGEVSIKEIRDVTVEDLLHRDEISLSSEEIANYLKDEVILVTGGGGSIGSELCRQIAAYEPKSLLIFDIYENNAYDLQNELYQTYKDNLDVKIIIGSIRDKRRLDYVFSKYKPGIVFHAAAHKHVPLMEEHPQEAVKNNVFGTLNLAECADHYETKKFVLISTDKAVNPTSIMGATKRVAELIIKHMNESSKTKYSAVRFGNVLGSSGSVIPLFKKQIECGGPIQVTHPDITRYFMTIPEASSLVIQSGAMMDGGEIFVLDMGKPIKILKLAKSLITLSGLKPDIDISIEFIGLRPGEKLHEELLLSEEGINITKNNKIFIEKSEKIHFEKFISQINSYRYKNLEDEKEIIEFLNNLIPIQK